MLFSTKWNQSNMKNQFNTVCQIVQLLYTKKCDDKLNLLEILLTYIPELSAADYRQLCILATVERQKTYPNQFVIMLPTTDAQVSICLDAVNCINGITVESDTYPIQGQQGFQTGATPVEQAVFGSKYQASIKPISLDPSPTSLSAINQRIWSDDNGDAYVIKSLTQYPVGLIMMSDGNILQNEVTHARAMMNL